MSRLPCEAGQLWSEYTTHAGSLIVVDGARGQFTCDWVSRVSSNLLCAPPCGTTTLALTTLYFSKIEGKAECQQAGRCKYCHKQALPRQKDGKPTFAGRCPLCRWSQGNVGAPAGAVVGVGRVERSQEIGSQYNCVIRSPVLEAQCTRTFRPNLCSHHNNSMHSLDRSSS